jgi:hypothetical protein
MLALMFLAVEAPTRQNLPVGQAAALLDRMLVTEPFLGSREERENRRSVGRHFSRGEYARLRGNPLLGYWDEGGFRWPSGQTSVAWAGVINVHPSSRPIGSRSWTVAFREVARRQGLIIRDASSVRIQGACVGAVVDPSSREPVPGVLLELRVSSPTGTLLYRVGVGKATVEDAMGAALELVVRFARTVGNPTEGRSLGAAQR